MIKVSFLVLFISTLLHSFNFSSETEVWLDNLPVSQNILKVYYHDNSITDDYFNILIDSFEVLKIQECLPNRKPIKCSVKKAKLREEDGYKIEEISFFWFYKRFIIRNNGKMVAVTGDLIEERKECYSDVQSKYPCNIEYRIFNLI